MPIRPFPARLNIGTDICSISRIHGVITKAPRSNRSSFDRFCQRLFTDYELEQFCNTYPLHDLRDTKLGPLLLDRISAHLAGRYAAKEAIVKAVSWDRLTFDRIIIHTNETTALRAGKDKQVNLRPSAIVLDKPYVAYRQRIDSQGVQEEHTREVHVGYGRLPDVDGQSVEISISHDNDFATAVCLAPSDIRDDHSSSTSSDPGVLSLKTRSAADKITATNLIRRVSTVRLAGLKRNPYPNLRKMYGVSKLIRVIEVKEYSDDKDQRAAAQNRFLLRKNREVNMIRLGRLVPQVCRKTELDPPSSAVAPHEAGMEKGDLHDRP